MILGILTNVYKSIFLTFKPIKSIPTNPSLVWFAKGDQIFSILEFPVPYSCVKYKFSILTGRIIVFNPLIIQLEYIFLIELALLKSSTALSANVTE